MINLHKYTDNCAKLEIWLPIQKSEMFKEVTGYCIDDNKYYKLSQNLETYKKIASQYGYPVIKKIADTVYCYKD